MVRTFLSTLVGALLLMTGCMPVATQPAATPPATDQPTPTPIKLGVGFIPSVQFAPLYVGIAKGYFADEGIDLQLDYGFENDYLKLVGLGEYQFMIGSGDQVVLGRAQGLPVRYVMNWYTRYPVVAFAKADRNILAPADLKGQRIGLPGLFGANYVALRGLLEAGDLTERDVTLESIGFTQAAAVRQDIVDVAIDYAVNGPVVLTREGVSVNQIGLDDYLTMPANGLVTNETTIAERPQLAAALIRAFQRAVRHTLDHPDEAFQIALEFVPEAGDDNEAANRAIFDASLAYWTPAPGARPGATSTATWQEAAAFMQRIGLVDALVQPEDLFTNELLPQ